MLPNLSASQRARIYSVLACRCSDIHKISRIMPYILFRNLQSVLYVRFHRPGQFCELLSRHGCEFLSMDNTRVSRDLLFDFLHCLTHGHKVTIPACILASKRQHGLPLLVGRKMLRDKRRTISLVYFLCSCDLNLTDTRRVVSPIISTANSRHYF